MAITSSGLGSEGWHRLPYALRPLYAWALPAAHEDKERMQEVLRTSGLDVTLVQPAFLLDGEAKGSPIAQVREALLGACTIRRAGVGDVMFQQSSCWAAARTKDRGGTRRWSWHTEIGANALMPWDPSPDVTAPTLSVLALVPSTRADVSLVTRHGAQRGGVLGAGRRPRGKEVRGHVTAALETGPVRWAMASDGNQRPMGGAHTRGTAPVCPMAWPQRASPPRPASARHDVDVRIRPGGRQQQPRSPALLAPAPPRARHTPASTMADPSIDTSAVPAGQQQSWGQFIKSLASFSGDLSALTAPSFILSPTSLIEFSA